MEQIRAREAVMTDLSSDDVGSSHGIGLRPKQPNTVFEHVGLVRKQCRRWWLELVS